jgi:serine protease Do
LLCGVTVVAAEADGNLAPPPQPGKSVSSWLRQWSLPDENERSHASVRSAFREIVAPASHCTVRVLSDDLQTALGIVVHAKGLVLTKASEVTTGRLECVLPDRRRLPARRISSREDLDLAILRIPAEKLPVVEWSELSSPQVGSWLATPNIDGEPAAIGVVSMAVQQIPPPLPVLGVGLGAIEGGVLVQGVGPGTGAARAGLRPGDVITKVNGQATQSPDALTEKIRRLFPGDRVTLVIVRAGETMNMTATLGDRSRAGQQEQAELMDSLGGPLSRRRAGFASVLQHDTVLRPRDCGGPVVDLDGKVVGVNIARASRVATYALPSSLVRSAMAEMLTQGQAVSPEQPVAAVGAR